MEVSMKFLEYAAKVSLVLFVLVYGWLFVTYPWLFQELVVKPLKEVF